MMNRFDRLYAKLKSRLVSEDSLDAGVCAETEAFKSRVKQIAKQLADELDYGMTPDEFYTELDKLAGMGAVDDFQVLSKMDDAKLKARLSSIMEQMKENDEDRMYGDYDPIHMPTDDPGSMVRSESVEEGAAALKKSMKAKGFEESGYREWKHKDGSKITYSKGYFHLAGPSGREKCKAAKAGDLLKSITNEQVEEGPFVISTVDGWFRNGSYNERGEFLSTTVNDISVAHKFATREEAEETAEKMRAVYKRIRFKPPKIEVHALADEGETYKPSLFGW